MKKNLQLSTTALLVCAATSSAATIANYTFDNGGGTASVASTDTDTDTTASVFATGAGFSFIDSLGAIGGTTGGAGLDTGTTDDLADAIANNEYFTFTVDAVDAATFDLEGISFDYGRWSRGAQDFYLFTSVGGFTAGDELLKVNDIAQSSSTALADSGTATFDFTTVGDPSIYEGLTSVEFRIYLDDRADNLNAGSGTMLDNVFVTATVPEPGTFALIGGLFALTSVMLRRRQS